jgi:hypothetical protein
MVAAIQAIMPTSGSCPGGNDECRTAKQAAPFLSKACADLSDGECAATLALIGLESGDLKYKHNIGGGLPGQGTANMMSPTVSSLPAWVVLCPHMTDKFLLETVRFPVRHGPAWRRQGRWQVPR